MKRYRRSKLPKYRRRKRGLRFRLEAPYRSPSVHAWFLHRQKPREAIARAERLIGTVDDLRSPLLKYRWTSDFQADWKREIGHWLHTAEEHGYADALVARVVGRRKGSRHTEIHPNDQPHLTMQQELAPAKIAHYFIRTGWAFEAWEPEAGGAIDIDLRLRAPSGAEVDFQIKAPDRPGEVVNRSRIKDGENDDHVIAALIKAAGQLPRDSNRPSLIAVTALRRWPLSSDCRCVVVHAIGSTTTKDGRTSLWGSKAGTFFRPEWAHVSGIVLLDYLRGETFRYACTVLLNPNATHPASPDWFPYGRVCILDGDTFRWVRGAPSIYTTLPDGTPFDRHL